MIVKALFVQIGKTEPTFIKDGLSMYEKRIRHYIPFEIITIPEIRGSARTNEEQLKGYEGQALLNVCKQGDYVVLLDELGHQYSSRDFAGFIEKQMISRCKRILFLTGGAFGVSKMVHDRSDKIISLSQMTFSHQLVRLIFIEQFYRALTIIKGEPYHHG